MAKQILVPLKRYDRVEDVIPYVEKITQPGMKVTFLLRYPLDGIDGYIQAGAATGETGMTNPTAVRKIAERFTWASQLKLARERVLPACEDLQKKGSEVSVEVYTGGWKKVVRSRALEGDVHLIVTRSGTGFGIANFLQGAVGLFKQPTFSPVPVLHPGTLS